MTTSCLPRALRFLAIAVLTLTALGLRAASPATFDIPAQPAPAALKQFIKQSGTQVVYIQDDLKAVTTKAVKGDLVPADALAQLLDGTGFSVETMANGNFTISRPVALKPGSIEGVIRDNDSGRGVSGARVAIAGTALSVLTDKRGRFTFAEAPAGDHTLEITADGIQNTKVTDVSVKTGHKLTLSTINVPAKSAGVMQLDPFVVSAKKNEGVIELDPFSVEGRREKTFSAGNLDIPRTINDAQPYYIFDAKMIDSSGAVNAEDFLKQRLTMNTVAQANGETSGLNTLGNTSSVNLRGLGTDKTLVLVNGKRMAGVSTINSIDEQPDLNGIPLSAIERIEVLPSSASGIYGGNAIGGVVNVILKRDYQGGEIRASYDNKWDTDAPRRNISAAYGFTLGDGKTHVSLRGAWADAKPLLLQDRLGIYEGNMAAILARSPSFIYSNTTPWLGALPNITPNSSSQAALILKNGNISLGSRNTFVPAGTSASTSQTELRAGYLGNAGKWNMEFPASTQSPTGILRPFGTAPETRSFGAAIRRQMLPRLELLAEFSFNKNESESVYNPLTSYITVPTAAPTNLFTTDVRVRVPDAGQHLIVTDSQRRSATLGALVQMPHGWTGSLDYSWSQSRFSYSRYGQDNTAIRSDLLSGALNPFVDTLLHPLNMARYLVPYTYSGENSLHDYNLRAAGMLPALPWGQPSMVAGLEQRIAQTPLRTFRLDLPVSVADSYEATYFARKAVTRSAYMEATLPLIKGGWLAGMHTLDLQLSGRSDQYNVDTGTNYRQVYFKRTPQLIQYGGPTLDGVPYFADADYTSSNFTVGLKYQPVKEIVLRISRATAFLPPTPDQLIQSPEIIEEGAFVNGTIVPIVTGGNPSLQPQNSKALNIGVIWQPTATLLQGLRVNAEYYKIEQFNAIGVLTAQMIVDQESSFPGRVQRSDNGAITLVDTSYINLYHKETEGWDVSANYIRKTALGTFSFSAVQSTILHLKNQYSRAQPELEAIGFPSEGGSAKRKSNVNLTWERRSWSAGWTMRYFGSYKQYGAVGGPTSTKDFNGGEYTQYILPQGGDIIPSQTYHDIFLGYAFGSLKSQGSSAVGKFSRGLFDRLRIQLGVRNIFGKVPPLDAYYNSNYFLSPYGDVQKRTYVVTLRKEF